MVLSNVVFVVTVLSSSSVFSQACVQVSACLANVSCEAIKCCDCPATYVGETGNDDYDDDDNNDDDNNNNDDNNDADDDDDNTRVLYPFTTDSAKSKIDTLSKITNWVKLKKKQTAPQ